jgi:hypothetical protein
MFILNWEGRDIFRIWAFINNQGYDYYFHVYIKLGREKYFQDLGLLFVRNQGGVPV